MNKLHGGLLRALLAALTVGAFRPLGFADESEASGTGSVQDTYIAHADGPDGPIDSAAVKEPDAQTALDELEQQLAEAVDMGLVDEDEHVISVTDVETGQETFAAGAVGNDESEYDGDDELFGD